MPTKICVIAVEFHKKLVNEMVEHAQKIAPKLKAEIKDIIWVPGSLEIPLIIKEILENRTYDALVILGYIEKGSTQHGEVMGHQVLNKILKLQLKYRMPMGLGIIGPGATLEQAKERTIHSSENAMKAAVKISNLKKMLNKTKKNSAQ